MNIKTLYPKLSKWCFFAFLTVIATTVLMSNILPGHNNATSHSEQCYWTNAMIVYIECGVNVPLGETVQFILNEIYALTIMPLVPFYILFFPPLLWAFVISFYFLVASYPLSKLRRRFWREPAPEKTARFYKMIKKSFIFLLAISIIFQAYQSYKKYLVNTTYWQAKLGIVSDKIDNDEDYSRALMTATYRGEIYIVKALFHDNYYKKDQFLEVAVNNGNYELVDFFLTHDVKITDHLLESSFGKLTDLRLCEKVDDERYKIFRRLLNEVKSPDNELLRRSAISLCSPLMETLLKAGGNPDYITPEGESLLDWAKKIKVTSNNAYNGWLYGKSQEEIENHRKQVIDLILEYQMKDK